MPRHVGFRVLVLAALLVPTAARAQSPDPEALYKANCSSCHDQPEGRTPPRDALKDRAPEAILAAMTTGSMAVNAINITLADKRRLAEFLSGKPFSAPASDEAAGLCAAMPHPIAALKSNPYCAACA